MKVEVHCTDECQFDCHCQTNDVESEQISITSSNGDDEVNLKPETDVNQNENIVIPQDSKSTSAMSITDEELVHGCSISKDHKLIESNTTIKMEQNELNSTSDEVQNLQNQNRMLMKKLIEFEQFKKVEKLVMKGKLETLGKWVEDKKRQVKELLNVIQMLDDANAELMNKASEWLESETRLKKEIARLKLSSRRDYPKTNMLISHNTADWKEKIQHDLTARESSKLGEQWRGNILSKRKKYDRFRSRTYRSARKSSKFLTNTHKQFNGLNPDHRYTMLKITRRTVARKSGSVHSKKNKCL